MGILYIIAIVFLLALFPFLRFFVMHPITCTKGAAIDIYNYIHYKKKNLCPFYGKIQVFVGSGAKAFGSGKTLSMVDWLRFVYRKYNGLQVYDEESKEFVTQHVIVVSNVQLHDIPYIPFIGRSQFVDIDKLPHGRMDIIIFAIDEAGAEFNSRNYRDNLPTDFLTRLLQVRHNRIFLLLSAQRFGFLDKILRMTCSTVITCSKKWRIVRLQEYDAFALENAMNPEMIQPLSTRYYYANDDLFNSYDTCYNVQKLKAQLESGDILNTQEILANIQNDGDIARVQNKIRRRYRRK